MFSCSECAMPAATRMPRRFVRSFAEAHTFATALAATAVAAEAAFAAAPAAL